MEATALLVVEPMTLDEARQCVNDIKGGMSNVRARLLELEEREGWRVLGYTSWRDCAMLEFGYEKSHVYRLLDAAKVERNLSPIGEKAKPIIESQLRPLVGLEPQVQREVYERAVATAPEGKVTAAHVERTVAQAHGQASHRAGVAKQVLDDDGDLPDTVTLRVARVVYLLTMGKHMALDEIAEKTGLTENGAWRLMNRLAGGRHVPVTTDMDDKWCILDVDSKDWAY